MSVWRLVLREIRYRRLNFCLAVLSVLAAVGCLVAVLALLRQHDRRTEELVAAQEEKVRAGGRKLEDDYRKIGLLLGFNILILPKDQNLAQLYAGDYAPRTMPEEYADRLARSGVVTVNHLLPSLRQRVVWKERGVEVIVMGIKGELPIANKTAKKQILDHVPPGTVTVGYLLQKSAGIKRGDTVALLGREFTVRKVERPRGGPDDITIRLNLADAQKVLGQEGRISEIQALECNCSAADRLGEVRQEIAKILPDTQVEEKGSEALARAEARNRAAAEARASVARVKQARQELREGREEFAAVLVPLVVLGCTVWVGLLAFTNARDRAAEVGILRALGVGAPRVFGLFLLRALLVGVLGGLLGYLAGSLAGALLDEGTAGVEFDPAWLAAAVVAAPVLCALASWVPALLAARQDPAVVLRDA